LEIQIKTNKPVPNTEAVSPHANIFLMHDDRGNEEGSKNWYGSEL